MTWLVTNLVTLEKWMTINRVTRFTKIREFVTFGVFTKYLAIFDRFEVNTKNGEKINKNKAKEQNFSRIIFTEKNHVDVKCHLIWSFTTWSWRWVFTKFLRNLPQNLTNFGGILTNTQCGNFKIFVSLRFYGNHFLRI